ncbi:MAG: hypothetical protein KJ607_14280 [Bacteroidetes bacterium]|nr:hypothetical protein [Bacteroidota bacterium]
MKLSGFTMCKNAVKLYYPIREAIESLLPVVDEFIVALGDCDEDDTTLREIESINSPKVKIIHTVWNIKEFPAGTENAHQTDIAKEACAGDWLIHLQADEVIHEKYLDNIVTACHKYLDDKEVEGMILRYRHFLGDYDHYIHRHGWYRKEIRIIRNDKEIHSFESAASFRRIPDFDGISYRKKEGTYKLKVAEVDAYVYHYGWVRPPEIMQQKSKALDTIHKGKEAAEELYSKKAEWFDYGAMYDLAEFKETHPKVMEGMIARFDWQDKLNYQKGYRPDRPLMKHEKFKSRLLTFIEHTFLGGRQLFAVKNYILIRKIPRL